MVPVVWMFPGALSGLLNTGEKPAHSKVRPVMDQNLVAQSVVYSPAAMDSPGNLEMRRPSPTPDLLNRFYILIRFPGNLGTYVSFGSTSPVIFNLFHLIAHVNY